MHVRLRWKSGDTMSLALPNGNIIRGDDRGLGKFLTREDGILPGRSWDNVGDLDFDISQPQAAELLEWHREFSATQEESWQLRLAQVMRDGISFGVSTPEEVSEAVAYAWEYLQASPTQEGCWQVRVKLPAGRFRVSDSENGLVLTLVVSARHHSLPAFGEGVPAFGSQLAGAFVSSCEEFPEIVRPLRVRGGDLLFNDYLSLALDRVLLIGLLAS